MVEPPKSVPTSTPDALNYKLYLGEWTFNEKDPKYDWLTEERGRFYLMLQPPNALNLTTVVMVMFDGEWQDDPLKVVVIHDSKYSSDSIMINANATFYNVKTNLTAGKAYIGSATLGEIYITQPEDRYEIDGFVSFPTQGNTLGFSARQVLKEDFLSQIVLYFCIYITLALMEFVAFSMNIEYAAQSNFRAKGISLLYIGMNASIDLAMSFWHFAFIFTDLFSIDLLSIPSSFSLILCFVAISPLAINVWKAQHPTATYVRPRQIEESTFKGRYISAVVLAAIGFFVLGPWKKLTILLMHLFFVPQIVMNVYENYRHSLQPAVYVLMAASRFGVVLYYFGYDGNFLVWQPHYEYCWLVGTLLGLQVALLHLQTTRGPRFFLPKSWFSQNFFSYYRSPAEEDMLEPQDCCICLNPLNLGMRRDEEGGRTVHTPCNHRYHLTCLQNWIAVNQQCPTCRRDIPEIED